MHRKRCLIYHKGSRFYADWRDSFGVRRRKAFAHKSEALAFEKEKKEETRKVTKNLKPAGVNSRFSVETMKTLNEVAALTGFSNHWDLIHAYVLQGLKADLVRIDGFLLPALAEGLRKRGVAEETISSVVSEVKLRRKPIYSHAGVAGDYGPAPVNLNP